MYLDEQTKSFLLKVLNEQSPPGGGANRKKINPAAPDWTGGGELITPEMQARAAAAQVGGFGGGGTGGAGGNVKPMSDKKYYSMALKSGLGAQGYDLEKEKSSNQPSLEYLGALGTLKRTMGYSTDPSAGVEMLGVPFVGKGGTDLGKLGRYATSKAAKTGLAAAILNTNMGQLGSAISGKLGRLALLGADPFDYATKVMGVDYVSDQISKLGKRQYQQVASGAGSIRL
jgi:hypothetical protein